MSPRNRRRVAVCVEPKCRATFITHSPNGKRCAGCRGGHRKKVAADSRREQRARERDVSLAWL